MANKIRGLFVGGTASDVGKSLLVTGLCRIFARKGISVAPFKAQNMSLNAAVTIDGGEIGRAQALQAQACGLPPEVAMNPVLLKPHSDTGCQVVLLGQPIGSMTALDYHGYKAKAWSTVQAALGEMSRRFPLVIMEGAGSVAEINLKAEDITNLRVAALLQAPVLLVADIDRGGVFAQVLGTLELLDPDERAMVKGVIINKFRGDLALLKPGIALLEARTGVRVLGVIPHVPHGLPEEDSVALGQKPATFQNTSIRIGVLRLPFVANYTDFDALESLPETELRYVEKPTQIMELDLLLLPGSKATLSDLAHLHERGFFSAIQKYAAAGGRVIGICGGYQMLGKVVRDPLGLESSHREHAGLGLLDLTTEMTEQKDLFLATGRVVAREETGLPWNGAISGYEIHMGKTTSNRAQSPLLAITRRPGGQHMLDGAVSENGRIWGTYLHGIFDNDAVRLCLINTLRSDRGWPGFERLPKYELETSLDRWANHVQQHLDMAAIYHLLDGVESAGVASQR